MGINATIFGQALTFAVLVWFTMKFVWPPVITAMRDRQARIAEGLAAAEKGAQAQEEAARQSEQAIREARQQAADILANANKRSAEIIEEAKTTALAEGDRLKAAANAEIEQETARARTALRTEVSGLAIAGAGRILDKEIDGKAHESLLDDLVAQL